MLCVKKGSSFLDKNEIKKRHLRIVLTDPNVDGVVATVSVTSLKKEKKQDVRIVLNCGDHPFIKHESVLSYRHCQLFYADKVSNLIKENVFIKKEDIPADLLEKIITAVLESKSTPRNIKTAIKEPELPF